VHDHGPGAQPWLLRTVRPTIRCPQRNRCRCAEHHAFPGNVGLQQRTVSPPTCSTQVQIAGRVSGRWRLKIWPFLVLRSAPDGAEGLGGISVAPQASEPLAACCGALAWPFPVVSSGGGLGGGVGSVAYQRGETAAPERPRPPALTCFPPKRSASSPVSDSRGCVGRAHYGACWAPG
jgi:hypothetical protein